MVTFTWQTGAKLSSSKPPRVPVSTISLSTCNTASPSVGMSSAVPVKVKVSWNTMKTLPFLGEKKSRRSVNHLHMLKAFVQVLTYIAFPSMHSLVSCHLLCNVIDTTIECKNTFNFEDITQHTF